MKQILLDEAHTEELVRYGSVEVDDVLIRCHYTFKDKARRWYR
jgi:hypothetical protein